MYASDFLSDADVQLLDNDAVGGLARLMCHDWVEGGLAYTEDELFELGRFKERSTGVQRILNKFTLNDGVRSHPKLCEIRKQQADRIEKCRIAGKKSGKARRNNR